MTPDPLSAEYWLHTLSKPPMQCPICETHGCKQERYAVTILDPFGKTDTLLIHAEDKEDAAIFGFMLTEGRSMQIVSVKFRGGGA